MQFTVTSYVFSEVPAAVAAYFATSQNPQGSWAWFQTLAQTTLGPAEQALLLVLNGGKGTPQAVLPVARHADGFVRALTAPYSTVYVPPLGSPDDANILGQLLRRHIFRRLELDALDLDHPPMAALVSGLRAGGFSCATYRHFANRFESIAHVEQYWDTRESRLRSTVRRKQRALAKEGRLHFQSVYLPAGAEKAVAEYERVYALSWKEPEPHPAFIPTLIHRLGREGSLRISFAIIDGVVAAAQMWLVGGAKATIFKLAQDPAFDKHSPGTLLTHWMIGQAVQYDQVTEIDFGRGDDRYKRDWLKDCRYRSGLIACNSSTPAGLYDTLRLVWPTRLGTMLRRHRGRA